MTHQLQVVEKIWPSVSNFLSIPRNDNEYNKLVELLDELIDEIGNNENHKFASLMETIGLLIEKYENVNQTVSDISGVQILRELMTEYGLNQNDLKEIGSQGVVSEIMNGKRELNIRQIKALSEKFSVSPSVFF